MRMSNLPAHNQEINKMTIQLSVEQMPIVQSKLAVPKGQVNSFGGYKYRSCEDILESVKPILAELKASISISDDMVMLGDRFYVQAVATITFADGSSASGVAYAREPLNKKGMDEAQITGATSSYARKYALNGLLAIDDTKDADTKDNRESAPEPVELNLEHVTALSTAPTMEELIQAWNNIASDGDVRTADYISLKNEAKKRLS